MKIYVTSKSDPRTLIHISTSLADAINAVGDFVKYEYPFPKEFPNNYSGLPYSQERTLERFYMADGWWYSVESIELVEDGVISTGWFVPEDHV